MLTDMQQLVEKLALETFARSAFFRKKADRFEREMLLPTLLLEVREWLKERITAHFLNAPLTNALLTQTAKEAYLQYMICWVEQAAIFQPVLSNL